jgi:hypothetical protein
LSFSFIVEKVSHSCNGKFDYNELEVEIYMRIQIQLSVDGESVKQDTLVIQEQRLGDLTDEEIESAIEINIRSWVDRMVQVEWEVLEDED